MRPVCRECACRLRILRAVGLLCMSCPSPERGYTPPFCHFLPETGGAAFSLLLVRMTFAFATHGLRLFCCATRAAKKGAAGKTSSVFLFCRVGVSFCAYRSWHGQICRLEAEGRTAGADIPAYLACLSVYLYIALTSVYPAFATHGIAFRRPYDRTASLCFLPPHLPAGAVFLQPARRLSFLRLRPAPLFCSTPAPFYTPSDLFRRARRIPRPAPERAGRRARDGQAVIFVVPLLPKRPRGKTGKRQSGKICLSPRRRHGQCAARRH